MKLELGKYNILTIKGEKISEDVTVATQLAEFLSRGLAEKGNSKKFFGFAVKLVSQGSIDCDESDWDSLYKFVEENKVGMNILVNAQIIDALEKEKKRNENKQK